MFKWFLIDGVNGDYFQQELEWATTSEEAVEEATEIWNSLSQHDKKRRDCFYVMQTDTNEDGVAMQENALEIIDLLEVLA